MRHQFSGITGTRRLASSVRRLATLALAVFAVLFVACALFIDNFFTVRNLTRGLYARLFTPNAVDVDSFSFIERKDAELEQKYSLKGKTVFGQNSVRIVAYLDGIKIFTIGIKFRDIL